MWRGKRLQSRRLEQRKGTRKQISKTDFRKTEPKLSVPVRSKTDFYGEKLLAPPKCTLEENPLSALSNCLFNIFSAVLDICNPSLSAILVSAVLWWWRTNCRHGPVPVSTERDEDDGTLGYKAALKCNYSSTVRGNVPPPFLGNSLAPLWRWRQ